MSRTVGRLVPPYSTLKQAKNYTSMMLKGDPERGGIVRNAARQMLATVLPGRGLTNED